ncbi:MAG: NRDE family protein [Gracilimonas sp.]|nr:NRDE family protein [Gracilimonas sp.]
MCLITFAYKKHPKYELILAGNRDEFYGRPTRSAQFWTDEGHPDILAGKDLEAGGTWLGIHKDGRWGALTNYRDPTIIKEDPPSRGELVMNYLTSDSSAIEYLQDLSTSAQDYNGFNLLLWDSGHFYHFSNQSKRMSTIEPGIHGLKRCAGSIRPGQSRIRADAKWKATIKSRREFSKEKRFRPSARRNQRQMRRDLPASSEFR